MDDRYLSFGVTNGVLSAVVITVLNAYSGFALVAEGELYSGVSNSSPLELKHASFRFHVGQPTADYSRFLDRCQRFNSVVHHGK